VLLIATWTSVSGYFNGVISVVVVTIEIVSMGPVMWVNSGADPTPIAN
jgi:hypothetical protein